MTSTLLIKNIIPIIVQKLYGLGVIIFRLINYKGWFLCSELIFVIQKLFFNEVLSVVHLTECWLIRMVRIYCWNIGMTLGSLPLSWWYHLNDIIQTQILICLIDGIILVITHENAIFVTVASYIDLWVTSLLIIFEETKVVDGHHLLQVFWTVLFTINETSRQHKLRFLHLKLAIKHFRAVFKAILVHSINRIKSLLGHHYTTVFIMKLQRFLKVGVVCLMLWDAFAVSTIESVKPIGISLASSLIFHSLLLNTFIIKVLATLINFTQIYLKHSQDSKHLLGLIICLWPFNVRFEVFW